MLGGWEGGLGRGRVLMLGYVCDVVRGGMLESRQKANTKACLCQFNLHVLYSGNLLRVKTFANC